MGGFANDVLTCSNVNFTGLSGAAGKAATLLTNGQLIIGSTALNAGGTHINIGSITSPSGSITIGYSSPNITIDLAGSGTAIDSIAVQTGTSPITPTAGGLVTINGAVVAAGTNPVRTNGTGLNTMAVQVQIAQALAATDATKIGLSNFDSASFAVDANGFVTLTGGGGITWADASGTFTAAKNHGYFITGTATANLPASPSIGDTIMFFVDHASQVLTIDAAGTQLIRLATAVTSAGGTFTSTAQGDAVTLVYRSTNTSWEATSFVGAWDHT
jgi:hypothetical protein